MRRVVLLGLAAALPATAAAPAVAEPSLTASPSVVGFHETLTIGGQRWPVIEFCSRDVRLSLRSAQNAVRIGTVRTSTRGRFSFEFVPRPSEIGAGRWSVVARMRCESGDDGSPVIMRASDGIRITAGAIIHARPSPVSRGRRVRVFGRVPGCARGDRVTLISDAFSRAEEFAGKPAVFAEVGEHRLFSVRTRVPASRAPGRYEIAGRCGGGRFGDATLRVRR